MDENEYSVFDELEQNRPPRYATNGQRFVNFIIDTVVNIVALYIITFILVILNNITGSHFTDFIFLDDLGSKVQQLLYGALESSLMYSLIEGASKGRTLGKLVTGTRAVREDGSSITWRDAFTRSICRQLPFETLSIFVGPEMWHDRIAKTRVVQIDKY